MNLGADKAMEQDFWSYQTRMNSLRNAMISKILWHLKIVLSTFFNI
jgi:hypothetical protein